MELTKLSPELIASNKTTKRRALKHSLISYLENMGFESDDQGDHITFDNDHYSIWYRPSHNHVDVSLQNSINSSNTDSHALEIKINKAYTNTMRKLGL
jgi:hypothetical protein|tara:strand:- start:537 stop:830 length:294 start_codon:yes stop_codon:yes gene_type:complete